MSSTRDDKLRRQAFNLMRRATSSVSVGNTSAALKVLHKLAKWIDKQFGWGSFAYTKAELLNKVVGRKP